jgi:hypothetical protein
MGCPITQNSLNTRYLHCHNYCVGKLSSIAIQVNAKGVRMQPPNEYF